MHTGKNNPNWKGGKSHCLVCDKELYDRRSKYCVKHSPRTNPPIKYGKNSTNWRGGMPFCLVCNKQLSSRKSKYCNIHAAKHGKDHPSWKDPSKRITILNKAIRNLPKMKEWESLIKDWDNYTCQYCGKRGGYLHTHHIKMLKLLIKENNIQNLEEAESCNSLWDVSNGITYCKECHDLLNKKGGMLCHI